MVCFSIIIPLYNTENYIEKCLKSVMRQTYENYECIIINDGSTDLSCEKAKEYIKSDNRFIVLEQENKGLSMARNYGILKASGDYLVFLDSDDFLEWNGLAQFAEIIGTSGPDVIMSNIYAYCEEEDTSQLQVLRDTDMKASGKELFKICIGAKGFPFAAWVFTVKRSFYIEKGLWFEPGFLHEDELWFPQLMLECPKVYFYSGGVYHYRYHRDGSIMQSLNIKKLADKLKIIEILQNYGKTRPKGEKCLLDIRCTFIMTGIIKESNRYVNNSKYSELHRQMIRKLPVLKAGYGKYKFLYLGCKILGIKIVSRLWNMLEKNRF